MLPYNGCEPAGWHGGSGTYIFVSSVLGKKAIYILIALELHLAEFSERHASLGSISGEGGKITQVSKYY